MPVDDTTPLPADAWDNTTPPAVDTSPGNLFPSFDENVSCILRDLLNIQDEKSSVLCAALVTANCNNWDEFKFLNEDLVIGLTYQDCDIHTPISHHHVLSLATLVAYMDHLETTKGAGASLTPSNYNVADYEAFRHSHSRKATVNQTTAVAKDAGSTASYGPECNDAEDLSGKSTILNVQISSKRSVPILAVSCCLLVGIIALTLITDSVLFLGTYVVFCVIVLTILCLPAALNAQESPAPDIYAQKQKFPSDVYSFVAIFSPKDEPDQFFFGILVFLFQSVLFMLMIMSVISGEARIIGEVDNPDTGFWSKFVPANVPPMVRITQIIAILSYMTFPEASLVDILLGSAMFPQLHKTNMSAEVYRMGLSCVLRCLQGSLGVFAVFLLVMTSTDVIDVILNFTAANFISLIDDSAFQLARSGVYGWMLEEAAKKVENQSRPSWSIPQQSNRRSRMVIFTITAVLSAFMTFVMASQGNSAKWITSTIQLKFGNALETFSGCYDIMPDNRSNNRYIYELFSKSQRHIHIGYCKSDQRWVLFEIFADDTKSLDDPCHTDNSGADVAVAYSSKTTSFDIYGALTEPWYSKSRENLELVVAVLEANNRKTCSAMLNDGVGVCDIFFNVKRYNYDGGDCCAATCTGDRCGQYGENSLTEFGTKLESGVDKVDYRHCIDPSMKEVFIELNEIKVNCKSPPTLTFECDDKTFFRFDLRESTTERIAAKVPPIANCTLNLEASENDKEPHSTLYYTVYKETNGRKNIIAHQGISTFTRGDHFQIFNIYHESTLESYAFESLQHETSLDLANRGLTGSIPSEIGSMTLMTSLNLESNSLTGSIPTEIAGLSKLTDFTIKQNSMTGKIPSEIGELSQLVILWLADNAFTGSIPSQIGSLSNLRFFRLDSLRNFLTGSIPSEIGLLSRLTLLRIMGGDGLTGRIPSEIGSFSHCTYFGMMANSLSGSIPTEIGKMKQLVWFDLSNNKLTGSIPSEIASLTELTALQLHGNQLQPPLPSEIGSMTKLRLLELSKELYQNIPEEITNLRDLSIEFK